MAGGSRVRPTKITTGSTKVSSNTGICTAQDCFCNWMLPPARHRQARSAAADRTNSKQGTAVAGRMRSHESHAHTHTRMKIHIDRSDVTCSSEGVTSYRRRSLLRHRQLHERSASLAVRRLLRAACGRRLLVQHQMPLDASGGGGAAQQAVGRGAARLLL